MINEANEPSSACRLWRIPQVETSTPPFTAPLSHHTTQSSRPKRAPSTGGSLCPRGRS